MTSSTGCESIIIKVLQFVLWTFKRGEDLSNLQTIPEIGVDFINGKSSDICEVVEVFFKGHCKGPVDLRFFVKTLAGEENNIEDLQLIAKGPCLVVSQLDSLSQCKSFSLLFSPSVGWALKADERFTPVELNTSFSVAVFVNASKISSVRLQSLLLFFLKKCQITIPYLTIIARINEKYFWRTGISPLQQEMSLCENLRTYIRMVSPTGSSCEPTIQYQYINVEENETSKCQSFSVIYGSTPTVDIGVHEHYHIFAFSKNGVPLFVETLKWHEIISPWIIKQNNGLSLEPGPCSLKLCDVCYLASPGPSMCYILLFLLKDEKHLHFLLNEQTALVASTLLSILKKIKDVATACERDQKLSEIMATSIGSIIRFSTDSEFRKESLEILEASDSSDAETKLKFSFLNQLRR